MMKAFLKIYYLSDYYQIYRIYRVFVKLFGIKVQLDGNTFINIIKANTEV